MRGSLQVIGACLFVTGCSGWSLPGDCFFRYHRVEDVDPDQEFILAKDETRASPASIAERVDLHSFVGDRIGEEMAAFRINLRVSPPANVSASLDGAYSESLETCYLGAELEMDAVIEIDFEDGPDVTLLGSLEISEMAHWHVVSFLEPGVCDRVFCTALGGPARISVIQKDDAQATLGVVEGYTLPISDPGRKTSRAPLLVTVAQ